MIKKVISFILVLTPLICFSQDLSYSDINLDSKTLISYLNIDENYFSGGSSDYPYFQGKINNSYIKFYRSVSTTCVIDIKSEQDYISLVREIQKNAEFRFKFCTDYQEPVVYNYVTSNGNKVRFNLNQMRISVEYPSSVSSLMDRNFGITPVFVCLSEDAYAFHTNLRCEGLGNCETDIAKSNIQEAKKYNLSFCEICTNDNY
ncbi:hypothetical protein ML462_15405 [Gramella lutea]|uniref:Uncharacterized protein n=1 Tax=Christiangramia lutea TaxID=1607951 RepID=A0A9X2AAB7_9FLAO|nr:hypothetical protein [Christiangramia lutea]MCH4824559.1 hypothetical protein [Christiangramia lutea]